MLPTLRLEDMSRPQKLELMEALWVDLTKDGDEIDSPEWHRDVLEERERQIKSGEAEFIDWEQAKSEIRQQIS